MTAVQARQDLVVAEPVAGDSSALMRIIERATLDPNLDVAKLEQLLAVKERWEANEARKAFNEAFSAFKAEAVTIIKNRKVDAGPLAGKKYAELFSVVNAVTPALSKHGLSASWKITKDEKDWMEVTCTVKHVLGGSDSATFSGPPDTGGAKNAIQARASTLTYLERYTLKAVCGLAEEGEDHDGNGGGKRMSEKQSADFLSAIDTAEDAQSLLAIYGKAHEAAIEAEDMGSLRLFTQHKDARKKAFKK